MKTTIIATTFGLLAAGAGIAASAETQKYTLDPSHSQVLFTYNHLGFSNTMGMFSGFEGEIMFEEEDPAASSVSVSFPVTTMITGWEKRTDHFMSEEFFDAAASETTVTFESTEISVTGDNTAEITGDLTMNGISKSIVLDTTLNKSGMHPMAEQEWLGFDATAQVLRSDFEVDKFAPYVADEVDLKISVEAMKTD